MDAAILQFFEGIRNPFLSELFGLFSLLGESAPLTAAILMLYWLLPGKESEQMLYTILSGLSVNALLKGAIRRPRPYAAGIVRKTDPFFSSSLNDFASFPSGHAETGTGFYGALCLRLRKKRYVALFSALVVLICLSRVYFGVHYPSDVLAGLLLGLFSVLFWAAVFRFLYPYRELLLLFFAAAAVVSLFFVPTRDAFRAAGLLAGAAAGFSLLKFCKISPPSPFPKRLWRLPVGGALAVSAFAAGLLFPSSLEFILLQWFFPALSAGLCAPLAFEKLRI